MSRVFAQAIAVALLAAWSPPAFAHPIPFSYLDLNLRTGRIDGSLVVHTLDLAHDLQIDVPERLLEAEFLDSQRQRIVSLLDSRLRLQADGRTLEPEWMSFEPLPERQDVRLRMRYTLARSPGTLHVVCRLFPYDPNHQTFLNVHERGVLRHQSIFDGGHERFDYYPGTRQGALAVISRFVPAGIHHIAVGPDHILFLLGLLLLGGGPLRLLQIVTAFTLGHSLTLSLAALDLVNPPSRVIEPAIALSIVYVGADNLLVTKDGRDVRAWIALLFGFIHGFGFAYVLREFGLPRPALAWSLFSFNVGVEIGQLAIVLVIASLLAVIRKRSAPLARWVVVVGSIGVIGAGIYWFVQRVFAGGA